MIDTKPLALSVERVRHEMLRGILVPREMVNEALAVTAAKLRAKETKFFSFKGRVIDTVQVEDHGTQLAAADQIFSLAGLYARERGDTPATPGVALEVDPRTGVVRIIVGGPPALAEGEERLQELPPSEPSPAEAPVVVHAHDEAVESQGKLRGGSTSPSSKVWKILTDEIVE